MFRRLIGLGLASGALFVAFIHWMIMVSLIDGMKLVFATPAAWRAAGEAWKTVSLCWAKTGISWTMFD